jgi:predicted DNA-binding protein
MATVKKLFSLDEHLAKELDLVASALNKTQREIVESALDFYFDYTDGILADNITKKIKEGSMKTYDKDTVYKELGIDL